MPNIDLAPYDPQQQALNRRRALAMALQQEGMAPLEAVSPGAPINVTQGLAKLLSAFIGARQNKKLDKEQKDLFAQQLAQRLATTTGIANAAIPPPMGGQAAVANPEAQGFDFPGSTAPPETPPTTKGTHNNSLSLSISNKSTKYISWQSTFYFFCS